MKQKENVISEKLLIYTLLQKFYAGELNKNDLLTWQTLTKLIKTEIKCFDNEVMKKGLYLLSQINEKDASNLEFDYNRLFVGPNRLEAPPYESTYRNKERAVLQRETLAVRNFYLRAGLEVKKKNIEPDDHLSIELEFICFLLENSLEDENYEKLYEDFLKIHLYEWIDSHLDLVREKANNNIIVGMTYIFEGLLEEEKKHIPFKRRRKR